MFDEFVLILNSSYLFCGSVCVSVFIFFRFARKLTKIGQSYSKKKCTLFRFWCEHSNISSIKIIMHQYWVKDLKKKVFCFMFRQQCTIQPFPKYCFVFLNKRKGVAKHLTECTECECISQNPSSTNVDTFWCVTDGFHLSFSLSFFHSVCVRVDLSFLNSKNPIVPMYRLLSPYWLCFN